MLSKNVLPALLPKLVGNFLGIFRREICRKFGGNCAGLFSDPQNEGSKISGEILEHFWRENFAAQENISCKIRSADVGPKQKHV